MDRTCQPQNPEADQEGTIFFIDKYTEPSKYKVNGAVYALVKILRNVMGSSAETEIG